MSTPEPPVSEPTDDSVQSVELDGEDGTFRVDQQNVGPAAEEGSGEWPDPDTPPRGPAPGTAGDRG
jgi:hypothetical protein